MVLDDAWNQTTLTKGHAGVQPVHITALVLGVLNFLLNTCICIAFHNNRSLFCKCHLHIFFIFALTNSLSGLFTVPTIVNLFIHNNLNCPRWTIMIGSAFEVGLDRMRKILTIMIAVERAYALHFPSEYYVMDHYKFAKNVCLVSATWSAFDTVAMIVEEDLTVVGHSVNYSRGQWEQLFVWL
ncbi:hypothetical protein AB6A40_003077 [Gnathostoma spinigerum]|uniref:G-protein coupled receptors family 1 profile domain-containing protein n=1 Tax=Gnathostoma spinigerum TaxID=75299 RepID=A0ABD6E8L1_9BILA